MPHTLKTPVPTASAPDGATRYPSNEARTQMAESTSLDAERLDVYRVALEFQVLASTLVPREERNLRDQLDRASLSVILNLAEGAGRRSRRDKRRFYSTSRGSATECAAIVDIVLARGLAPATACRRARSLLVRIVQMLTKLDRSLA
jgi:four helix bundle protein